MDKTPNLVTIRGGLTSIDASILKMRLERAGIFCHLANDVLSNMGGARFGSSGATVWVQVPDFEEARARAVLESSSDQMPEIDAEVLENEEEETEHCPVCGSDQVEYTSGSGDAIEGFCRACAATWTL